MPTPRYFSGETLPGKLEILIGIEGYSVDGDVKTFIFFRNIRLPGDLNTLQGQGRAADILTQLKLALDADGAVGPGIKLKSSNAAAKKIEVFAQPDVIGVYVEKNKELHWIP